MGITIAATLMRATQTRHTASRAGSSWEVTWLPGRALTRSQAVTAMQIAATVTTRDLTSNTDSIWGHPDGWAAGLCISNPDAASRPHPQRGAPRAARRHRQLAASGALPGRDRSRARPDPALATGSRPGRAGGRPTAPRAA